MQAAILEKQAMAVENMREHELEEGKRADEANSRWEVRPSTVLPAKPLSHVSTAKDALACRLLRPML